MAKRHSTDHFIDDVAHVADADRTKTFASGAQGLRPQPFAPTSQSLLLLGLPGSGCGPLAAELGERLDMLVSLLGLEDGAAPEAALAQAMRAMEAPQRIFVLDDRLAPLLDAQALSFLPVVPVYIIATVGQCLQQLATAEESPDVLETLRLSLVARQDALEPVAMTLAKHILRGEDSTAQQLAQLLDTLGIESESEDMGLPF